MDFLTTIFIFIIVLFLYVHILAQYKKSEDLEIYEMDYTTPSYLQEVCNVKQPILFEFKSILPEIFEDVSLEMLLDNGSHDVNVKDSNDYYNSEITSVDYTVIPFTSFQGLAKTDTRSHFFTENNHDFIEESGLYSKYKLMDEFIKPNYTVHTKYDIMMGSQKTETPLRFHINNHRYLCVSSGKIHVKMTPWKSKKYLHTISDYENYEFRSPINVWNPQPQYMNEMDKIKFLEFEVHEGYTLFIPPYWWYSIKYSNESDTIIIGATYNSAMNILSNTSEIARFYLQQQNTTNKIARTLNIDEPEKMDEKIDDEKNEK